MENNLFTPVILKRGEQLYKNNKVIDVEVVENTVYGKVKGTYEYDVSITFDKKREKVLYMSCDCPYGYDGTPCKHEAALYLYINNNHVFDNKSKSLSEIYNSLVKRYRYEYLIQHHMIHKINTYIDAYDFSDIETIEKLMCLLDEVVKIKCKKTQLDEYIDIIVPAILSFKNDYTDHLLSSLKQRIIKEVHFIYLSIFATIIYECKPLLAKETCLDILSHKLSSSYSEQLLEILFVLTMNHSYKNIIEHLFHYNNHKQYQYFILHNLLTENKIDEALKLIKKKKINLDNPILVNQKFQIIFVSGSYEECEEMVLKLLKEKEQYFILLDKLANKDQQKWNKRKYEIINTVINKRDIIDVLSYLNDYELNISYLLKNKSMNDFKQLSPIIKEQDIDIYKQLYISIIQKELKNNYFFFKKEEFSLCLKELQTLTTKEEMLHILLRLEHQLHFDSSFIDIIEDFIKKGGYEEYVEIIEY